MCLDSDTEGGQQPREAVYNNAKHVGGCWMDIVSAESVVVAVVYELSVRSAKEQIHTAAGMYSVVTHAVTRIEEKRDQTP